MTGWLCHIEPPQNPLCSLRGGEDIWLRQGFRELLWEHQLCEMLIGSLGKGLRGKEVSGAQVQVNPALTQHLL